ncbi:MAG: FAD-binding protein [Deltaproteobacteria bacterium]|nr:FAD-binding protein [Deltaproteobacteria bacterium]
METRYINSDLLIIGGGSAGCMAAIRAHELNPDLKITIFEKGDFKYSGSITRGMDALNVVSIPGLTTPELYVESMIKECQGIIDTSPSYLMAKRSYDLLKKLEKWGVYFIHEKDGSYRTLKIHTQGSFLTAMEEPDLKTMLAQKVEQAGVKVFNRIMGLELLKEDKQVNGAVGIHTRTGHLIVCKAKAVIMTAGGLARFTLPNSGYLYGTFDYPGNSGDGYTMAFKAGACLTGMEHTERGVLIKDVNIPLLAVSITRGGKVLDALDSVIMEEGCSIYGYEGMVLAMEKGLSPLKIRLSHLPNEKIEEIEQILFTTERPIQKRFFKNRGIDFRKQDIELWTTEHQLCGGHGMSGLYINEKAESTVSGLYAAGDVAAVPKQHLTGAFVFGEVAAEQAVEFVKNRDKKIGLNSNQVNRIEKKRNGYFDSSGKEILVHELEYKVRRVIGDYVVSPKNVYKLERWLESSKTFKKELSQQVLARNGHELSRIFELENIILCADMSAKAGLARTESRWGRSHARVDFPERDDVNWLKHVLVQKEDNSSKAIVSYRPILNQLK